MKDNNQLHDELFEEPSKTYNIVTISAVAIAAIGLMVGAWYVYDSYRDKNQDEVIIISADHAEVKTKPSNPGGMIVDNMDKTIYDTINNGNKDQVIVEKVLPAIEEPINKKSIEKIDNEEIVSIEKTVVPAAIPSNKVSEILDETDKQVAIPVIEKKEVAEEYIKPISKKKSKEVQFAKKNELFYKVQIGSFKSRNDAEKEWAALLKRFPKLLTKHQHSIVAKDIEGKGIFHRLQIGKFENESDARNACNNFKDKGLKCFIVKH